MDEQNKKVIRHTAENHIEYGSFSEDINGANDEVTYLSKWVIEALDALDAAERELETEQVWAANYREQLAGVPGDTPQQQIDWLLEAAGLMDAE